MKTRIMIVAVVLGGCVAMAADALADVFTWVDREGNVTVSNVAPPAGVRVTRVVKPSAAEKAAAERASDAQLRALTARVAELEQQAQAAASATPPPPVIYPAVAPAPVRFGTSAPPAIAPYATEEPPQYATPDCPPGWISCWGAWSLPASVVVIGDTNVHRHPHGEHGVHGARGAPRGNGRRPTPRTTPVAPMIRPLARG